MNDFSAVLVMPARSMTVSPSRARKIRKRIFPEKRVTSDVLAAFDALQQKGVVGVLRDLEERRNRRQKVGDDLLANRHKRAAFGEIDEFIERRQFHERLGRVSLASGVGIVERAAAAARRMTPSVLASNGSTTRTATRLARRACRVR